MTAPRPRPHIIRALLPSTYCGSEAAPAWAIERATAEIAALSQRIEAETLWASCRPEPIIARYARARGVLVTVVSYPEAWHSNGNQHPVRYIDWHWCKTVLWSDGWFDCSFNPSEQFFGMTTRWASDLRSAMPVG